MTSKKQTTDLVSIDQTEKPLNATQMKSLKQLVEGDFRDLDSRVTNMIESRLSLQIQEIEKKYEDAERRAETIRQSLREKVEEMKSNAQEFLVKAMSSDDLEFTGYNRELIHVTVNDDHLKVVGKDKEISEAREAARRLRMTAQTVIGRQERASQRQILLQGIGAISAIELLNDLPDADDVMTMVMSELEMTNESDLSVLMGIIGHPELHSTGV